MTERWMVRLALAAALMLGSTLATAAEGGTGEMHQQVVLRSREVTGPDEAWSDNPVLTQRDLPRDRPLPVTSAGHADFVQTQDGDWCGRCSWATARIRRTPVTSSTPDAKPS